ncbi:MAG: VTT domain-containing protein [Thermodesulfobacteriota bacterium]
MVTKRLNSFSNVFNVTFLFALLIIITSVVVPLIFREQIVSIGQEILLKYGQERIDIVLYLITTVSSTPIALPVWIYAVLGAMLGYEPIRLIIVMALGSMTGATITYFLARYFGKSRFVKKNFPNVENHPWTEYRSKWIISLILFFGAASPIPLDVMYAACGMKRFPIYLLTPILFVSFSIKFTYLFYGYDLIQTYLNIAF